jgi:ATP-dependent Clp protease, protease subunit
MNSIMKKDFELFARSSNGISSLSVDKYSNAMNNMISPYVIEERQLNISQLDIFSRLMMDRIIFLGTAIDDNVGNIITAQMLFLQSTDSDKPISLYLNTPGGGVYSGNSIIDTMELITPDVNTIVTGMAASMGFMIAIHGKHRSALKHARLMQHQPLGGASGQASDIEITARQIGIVKKELYGMISEKTGQPYEMVEKDADRDYWMTAPEAFNYGKLGAIDEVIGTDIKR